MFGATTYAWRLQNFTDLVVFGDSWTDNGRLNYVGSHNGSTLQLDFVAADGGRPWPSYVGQYTGANIHNYAVSGAVCANSLTPRIYSATGGMFPDIDTYELPAFIQDSQYSSSRGTKFMNTSAESTVYSIMIGGNDIGAYAFLTDSQTPGTTIVDYVDCVFRQIDRLFKHGGRYFVIHTLGAMYLAPQYAMPDDGGLEATQFWPDKYSNITGVSQRMLEQVGLTNAIYKSRMPLEVKFQQRYPGASFVLMNLEGLMRDIYHNPAQYLNGTPPYNVTGYINHCTLKSTDCVRIDKDNPDAFMWYDELHPSEQTWRIVANNFVDIINGRSVWATYLSA
ncbi:hypothetical protein B0O99DRAFT_697986 [Bisporella sp. PMI_857]|nr:hypothetical protein B0O99DRAFT_697986 [Bisporella sp. PMI_857]